MRIYHVTCAYERETPRNIIRYSSKVIYHCIEDAEKHIKNHMRQHHRGLRVDDVDVFYKLREIDTERVPTWETMFPLYEAKEFKREKSKSVAHYAPL